eukprot:scaffold13249_cov118-Isochrysis_galbana.AAC.1
MDSCVTASAHEAMPGVYDPNAWLPDMSVLRPGDSSSVRRPGGTPGPGAGRASLRGKSIFF